MPLNASNETPRFATENNISTRETIFELFRVSQDASTRNFVSAILVGTHCLLNTSYEAWS